MNFSRRLFLIVIVTSAALLALAGSASATERIAAPDGSGSLCTSLNPCAVYDAVTASSAGDTVTMLNGTYDIGATMLYVADGVVLRGEGQPGDITLSSTATAPAPAVKIDGGGYATDFSVIVNGSGPAIETWGGTASRVNAFTNSNIWGACRLNGGGFTDSVCVGKTRGVDGRFFSDTQYATLRNVTAIGREAEGIYVSCETGGSPTCNASLDAKAVIAQGVGADITLRQTGDGVVHADISNSAYGSLAPSEVSTTTGSVSVTDSNNITEAPIFTDAANGDYSEAPGSPTINTGAIDDNSSSTAYNGVPRVQGAAADIGAYEAEGDAPAAPTVTAPLAGPTKLNSLAVTGSAEVNSLVKVSVDGIPSGSATTDVSGGFSIPLTGLADGDHALAVTATDGFFNVSAATTVAVRVDTKAPKLKKLSVKTKSGKVTVKFKSSEKAKYTCKLDKGKAKSCKSPFKTKARKGKHKLVVTATDAAGNAGKSLRVSWRVH